MDKRYQVFVSSTYEDLREERQEVMQALLELDCIPSGMELFPAADEDQWSLIKRVIDDCDYYILIVGGRYGSAGPEGKSYTQMEYEYAVEKGLPVMAFLHENPDLIPSGKAEQKPEEKRKLEEFREAVKKRHCKLWSSPKELGGVVSRGIARMMNTKPRVGWVRADRVPDESSTHELLRLRKRIDELEQQLQQSRIQPPLGAESLAQGDETTELIVAGYYEGGWGTERIELTWTTLLATLGPLMVRGEFEMTLQIRLADVLANRLRDSGKPLRQASLRDEDLQKVLLQFRALGYIEMAVLDHNSDTRWRLTPHGNYALLQTAAIRSRKAIP